MNPTLAVEDKRGEKLAPAAFRLAWTFKGDAIPKIQQLLEGVPHPWIHGCCGSAVIPGEDRRIDLYHPSGEPIDLQEIDKHVQGAGAIIIDPPYPESAWDLPTRQRVVSACARALAVGGRLIVHAPWQPRFPRRYMRLVEPSFLRDDAKLDFPMPPVLLCAYERQPDPDSRRRRKATRSKQVEAERVHGLTDERGGASGEKPGPGQGA